ncbi:hypothetical protein ID866_13271 [Astraeus odoratus]|nr:hypothetical protein ID866_13271 [Astraeus odoratus]
MQDWSLYKNLGSANHKDESFVVDELVRATGITAQHSAAFLPWDW